ncbi:AEC family transporter [Rhodococcus sp. ACPA1]|uniref:AEC family transporter n=1 Tax=unclassified Rhodococcus (in: high G+C Gram-positive bacteria) TaxID=192944 RepID=UPI000BB10408|nr:AEC family transporter [Rhodococcus sp. ACPA1]NHU47215.1 AEC family transporter [Rhodococcus sp. A14]PBC47503.1 auxin efflux carrier [Rhodococcus sp. ACPA1]
MSAVSTAIVPIVLLLVLGLALRRHVLTDAAFWRGLESLTYFVFTPALFVHSLADVDLSTVPVLPIAAAVIVPVTVMTGILIVCRRPLRLDGPALTSMIQGSTRLNTYIGLSLVFALHGQDGVATFALAAAVMVPTVNIVCVTALSVFGDQDRQASRVPLVRALCTNPLVLGCLAGLLLNLLAMRLPGYAASTISTLAAPALACGTLVAGASVMAGLRRTDLPHVALASILKLGTLPLAAVGIAALLGVRGVALDSIIIICAVPTSPSAYILATRMGGNAQLMGSITAVQTILALATLPLMLTALGT